MNTPNAGYAENEQILSLLEAGETDESIRSVIDDVRRAGRMLSSGSFHADSAPEQFLHALRDAYRDDLYAMYGPRAAATDHPGSSFLQLEQMQRDLMRIAAIRLRRSGRLTPKQPAAAYDHARAEKCAAKRGCQNKTEHSKKSFYEV